MGASFKIISIDRGNNKVKSSAKLEEISPKDFINDKNINYTKSDKIEVTADIYN